MTLQVAWNSFSLPVHRSRQAQILLDVGGYVCLEQQLLYAAVIFTWEAESKS